MVLGLACPRNGGSTQALIRDFVVTPGLPPERYLTAAVRSSRMLRKPVHAKHVAAFREDVREQARGLGFEQLEVPVAVSLSMSPPVAGQPPQLPKVVKAYLDALEGIAYANDRQVEYLQVRQDGLAHPMMDGYTPEPDDDDEAFIFIEVEPVVDYTERYDRAVRRALIKRDLPWWPEWSASDEARLIKLRRQMQAEGENASEGLREVIRMDEERRLTDGVLADIDRPGPLPEASAAVHRVLPIQRFLRWARRRGGATFWIPLLGQERGSSVAWNAALADALDQFVQRGSGLPLKGFIALDIAVRGQSLEGKDLDNLAHSVLIPFEQQLCVRRGTVIGYRAYSAPGKPDGIQVRVMDSGRLPSWEPL